MATDLTNIVKVCLVHDVVICPACIIGVGVSMVSLLLMTSVSVLLTSSESALVLCLSCLCH